MLTMADKGGRGGGLDPPFWAHIICEQPLSSEKGQFVSSFCLGCFSFVSNARSSKYGQQEATKNLLIYPDMAQLFTDSIELDYLKYKFPHLSNHYSATPFIPSIPFQHVLVGISPYALFHFHHFKLGHKHECTCHFGEELSMYIF